MDKMLVEGRWKITAEEGGHSEKGAISLYIQTTAIEGSISEIFMRDTWLQW